MPKGDQRPGGRKAINQEIKRWNKQYIQGTKRGEKPQQDRNLDIIEKRVAKQTWVERFKKGK